jgi:hypothetical protein
MRWLLFGAVLGVLLLWPSLLRVVVAVAAAVASQPVVVAFALGLAVRPHRRRPQRWTS